jgi:hypothetical protein
MEADVKLIEGLIESTFPDGKLLSLNVEPDKQSSIVSFRAVSELMLQDSAVQVTFVGIKSVSSAALFDISHMRNDSAERKHGLVLLFSYVSPEKQAILRGLKLNYIDKAGNAWIEIFNHYIDKQGFRPITRTGQSQKWRNVFSDKSSLILRLLLDGDGIGIRDMSRQLSGDGFPISVGYISKVVQSLVDERYARRKASAVYLTRRRELLNDWAADYKKRNHPEQIGLYFPAADPKELIGLVTETIADGYAISGLAGAWLVNHYASFEAVDVFAKNSQLVCGALIERGARMVDRGSNINIVAPHYSVSAFYGQQDAGGASVTSSLQIYLDLLCQPIRGLEAAEHLYRSQLDSKLRLSEEAGNE